MSGGLLTVRKTLLTAALASTFILMSLSPALTRARGDNTPVVTVNTLPVVSWLTANVSAQRIYHTLYDLQNYSTRYIYTTNCNASADYIYRDYSNSSNLVVQSQYFLYQGLMLRNVIAVLPAFNPANKP